MYMYIPLQLPVAGQLEQALQRLRENSQAMEELRQRAREREGEADRMEKALNRAQGELIRREKELSELRMNIARLQHGANEVKYCTFSIYRTVLLYWIILHVHVRSTV